MIDDQRMPLFNTQQIIVLFAIVMVTGMLVALDAPPPVPDNFITQEMRHGR